MFFPDTVGLHRQEEYTMGKRTLLIGSTGGFGGAMLRPLLAAGHKVTVMARPGRLPRAGVNVFYGDALKLDDLHRATEGHDNIVCGLNFPYTTWAKNWPQAVTALGQVASEHHARVGSEPRPVHHGHQTVRHGHRIGHEQIRLPP